MLPGRAQQSILAVIGLFVFGGLATQALVVQAAEDTKSVSVSATVVSTGSPAPNPSVRFQGLAAPSATLTITRGTTVVITQSTTAGATFDITLSDQPTGQQTYVVSADDEKGRALAPVTFALDLQSGTSTIITGIFLGPSISIDKDRVKIGQFVTVFGTTVPGSSVTVTVNSVSAKNFSITADGNGDWSKIINTEEIGIGSHTATARSVYGGNQTSAQSSSVAFAVNPLEQCDGKKTADLNCDGKVNLVDFSILLFFWQQTSPRNERADINRDGRVTIVDFSIMLFQWTG